MGDQTCQTLCEQSGWLGELVLLLLVGGRALFVGWKNKQLGSEAVRLALEAAKLQAKVEQLSLRPPPAPPPVTFQLAPHPSLSSLYPIGIAGAPADARNTEKNQGSAGQSQAPTDPDLLDPPHEDEP
jgi:hypothetical protein